MEVIDSDRDTAFAVTALLISAPVMDTNCLAHHDLDTKQRILGSEGIDEAINHLNDHLNAFLEEE
jgi:hypothetical protein